MEELIIFMDKNEELTSRAGHLAWTEMTYPAEVLMFLWQWIFCAQT